jgi:hypothetical protein
MCRLNHQFGREWNHELAGLRVEKRSDPQRSRAGVLGLEPSVGQNCEIGSIEWPQLDTGILGLKTTE